MLLLVLGLVLVGVNYAHNASVDDRPLVVPLGSSADSVHSGSFSASRDASYEIELLLDLDSLDDAARQSLRKPRVESLAGLRWEVRSEDELVAAGDAAEYLYVAPWLPKVDRLLNTALRRDRHRELFNTPLARGIGRFEAHTGATYQLRCTLETPDPEILKANPRVAVRLERVEWSRLSHRFASLAILGAISIGAGAALGLLSLLGGKSAGS